MSSVLIVSNTGDPALATAARVAAWTAARLAEHAVHVVTDPVRSDLATDLHERDGACFFTHGREDAILGNSGALLDANNLHLLRGVWLWLYACRAGIEFAGAAVHAGATCAVGFQSALLVEWDEAELPPDLGAVFRTLSTEIPYLLAAGERDGDALLQALVPHVDAVLDWYLDHPDAPGGFDISAQQLLNSLVVRALAVS